MQLNVYCVSYIHVPGVFVGGYYATSFQVFYLPHGLVALAFHTLPNKG